MRHWILFAVCAVTCEIGLAQGLGQSAVEARIDQVVSAYTPKNAYMGTVLVADDAEYFSRDDQHGTPMHADDIFVF
jgi:hypothetical protein